MEALGRDYRGHVAVTNTGKTCQKWTSQVPFEHSQNLNSPDEGLGDHNYCRNPDSEPLGPWCYTVDPAVRWAYCDVPSCYDVGEFDKDYRLLGELS